MRPQSHWEQLRRVGRAVNKVGFAPYSRLAGRKNLIFSALGVCCVLSMLQESARGETRESLDALLRGESCLVARSHLEVLLGKLRALSRPREADLRDGITGAENDRLELRPHRNRAWRAIGTRAMLRRPVIEPEGGT